MLREVGALCCSRHGVNGSVQWARVTSLCWRHRSLSLYLGVLFIFEGWGDFWHVSLSGECECT